MNVFSWSKSPENLYIFSHFLIYILTCVYIIVIFIIFKICLLLYFLQFGAVLSVSSRMMDILSFQNILDMLIYAPIAYMKPLFHTLFYLLMKLSIPFILNIFEGGHYEWLIIEALHWA